MNDASDSAISMSTHDSTGVATNGAAGFGLMGPVAAEMYTASEITVTRIIIPYSVDRVMSDHVFARASAAKRITYGDSTQIAMSTMTTG